MRPSLDYPLRSTQDTTFSSLFLSADQSDDGEEDSLFESYSFSRRQLWLATCNPSKGPCLPSSGLDMTTGQAEPVVTGFS